MKKSILAGVIAASLMWLSPAAAQAPFDWNGYYIGANAGYAWGRTVGTDIGDNAGVSWRNLGERFPNRADGFTGGVQAGYNMQYGSLVWGLEADFGYLGLKGAGQWDAFPDFIHTDASLAATFRGRIGVAQHNSLFYFTGGAILADLNNSVRLNSSQWVTNSTGLQWGWTVGAGIEWALNPQWSLKTEYLYFNFGKETVTADNCGVGFCNFATETAGSLVRVGLNYRFGSR